MCFFALSIKVQILLIKITNKSDLMIDGLWFDWKEIPELRNSSSQEVTVNQSIELTPYHNE